MTTFLGVSPSDVCEWDTKPSATDPRVREQLASDRQCHRGVQAAQDASEPSLPGLGTRHRPTRDRGSHREDVAWQSERDRALDHDRQGRTADRRRRSLVPVRLTHQGPSSN
jgi:hypothetical protein